MISLLAFGDFSRSSLFLSSISWYKPTAVGFLEVLCFSSTKVVGDFFYFESPISSFDFSIASKRGGITMILLLLMFGILFF